jgi:hypothetical protein
MAAFASSSAAARDRRLMLVRTGAVSPRRRISHRQMVWPAPTLRDSTLYTNSHIFPATQLNISCFLTRQDPGINRIVTLSGVILTGFGFRRAGGAFAPDHMTHCLRRITAPPFRLCSGVSTLPAIGTASA